MTASEEAKWLLIDACEVCRYRAHLEMLINGKRIKELKCKYKTFSYKECKEECANWEYINLLNRNS